MRLAPALAFCLAAAARCSAQELKLGDVSIPIGGDEDTVIARLRDQFVVRPLSPGNWEVRSRKSDDTRTPLVAIAARGGRVVGMSFNYGPGPAPFLDVLYEQLSRALPENGTCHLDTAVRPLEGGKVRALRFLCGDLTIDCSSGTWPNGSNANISLTSRDGRRRPTRR